MGTRRAWMDLARETVDAFDSRDLQDLYTVEWTEARDVLVSEHRQAIEKERPGPRRELLRASALLHGLVRRLSPARRLVVLFVLSPLAFGRSVGRHALAARLFPEPPLADSNLDWGQDLPRLAALSASRGIAPGDLGVAYFGGDLPSFRVPGCVDLLAADAPLPRYVAVSRQLLLVGPETVPFADGRPRAARVLAELKARGAKVVARVGESIELFEVPPPK